jgi:hypothetical protein
LQDAINKPSRMPSDDFSALKQANSIVNKVKSGDMQEDDAAEALKELQDSVSTKKAQNAFSGAFDAIGKNMVDPSSVLKSIVTTRNSSLGMNPTVNKALGAVQAQI